MVEISELFSETATTGFPASNASRFFARAKRCFEVSFGLADFFRFPFLEPLDRVLRRFKLRFFFAIYICQLVAFAMREKNSRAP